MKLKLKYKGDKMRIVKAKSVKDYLDQYYKKDRYTGRGLKYATNLLKSYENDFAKNGYICTSRFDNVIGEIIAWPYYPKN